MAKYPVVSNNMQMVHGKLFRGFKQCMNTTWQSNLLFQAIHVEVFCDFNQYVKATW